MFKKLFKRLPPVSTPPPVDAPVKGIPDVEIDEDGSVVPAGLGVDFARAFCKDLSPETLDALFPKGLAGK